MKMVYNFAQYLLSQKEKKGVDYVIAYLKASQLAVSKYIANDKVSSLMQLNPDYIFPRLSHGLPKIIGPHDRVSIRYNNRKVIILWMSIFGIFRVLAGTYKLKLSTITDEFKGNTDSLRGMEDLIGNVTFRHLHHLFRGKATQEKLFDPLYIDNFLASSSSSPSSKVSFQGYLLDAVFLYHSNVWGSLKSWLELTENGVVVEWIEKISSQMRWYNPYHPFDTTTTSFENVFKNSDKDSVSEFDPDIENLPIGQLQFKKEAAGKVRVFALSDAITQTTFAPLHRWISFVLKRLPNDGTFCQDSSYKRARQLSIKYGCSFGFDLSAATDRLPISIQVSILEGLLRNLKFPEDRARILSKLWKSILTDRSYIVPNLQKGITYPGDIPRSVKYNVGQPMGALSSFNMLALTHHMIVQYCAMTQGLTKLGVWYDKYEITGDDLVLFDARIATHYKIVMDSLGLEINLKKSVISLRKAAGEYLKKTWIQDYDVSQLSWKQLYQNNFTLVGRVSDALYFIQKWSSRKKFNPGSIVAKVVPNWKGFVKPCPKDNNIALLALLQVVIKQSKQPLEDYLRILCFRKGALDIRVLFDKVIDLAVRPIEVIQILKRWFKDGEFDISHIKNPSWEERGEMLLNAQESIRLRVVEEIVKYIKDFGDPGTLGGGGWHPDLMSDLEFTFWSNSKSGIKLFIQSKVTYDLFQVFTSWNGFSSLRQTPKGLREDTIDILLSKFILPKFNSTIRKIREVIPSDTPGYRQFEEIEMCKIVKSKYGEHLVHPYQQIDLMVILWEKVLTYGFLRSLPLTPLISILEALIALKSFISLKDLEDKERRQPHKVSLSLLATLKPKMVTDIRIPDSIYTIGKDEVPEPEKPKVESDTRSAAEKAQDELWDALGF